MSGSHSFPLSAPGGRFLIIGSLDGRHVSAQCDGVEVRGAATLLERAASWLDPSGRLRAHRELGRPATTPADVSTGWLVACIRSMDRVDECEAIDPDGTATVTFVATADRAPITIACAGPSDERAARPDLAPSRSLPGTA